MSPQLDYRYEAQRRPLRTWLVRRVVYPSSIYLRKAAAVGFILATLQVMVNIGVIALEASGRPGLGWNEFQIPVPASPPALYVLYQTSNLASLTWLTFWIVGLACLMLGATRLPSGKAVIAVPIYLGAAFLLAWGSSRLLALAFVPYAGLVIVAWSYVRRRSVAKRRRWSDFRTEFLLWLVLTAIPSAFLWQDSTGRVLAALEISSLVLLIAVPFWFLLAFECVNFGIRLGKGAWRIGAHLETLAAWKRAAVELAIVAAASLGLGILPGNGIPINFMVIAALANLAIATLVIRRVTSAPPPAESVSRLVVLGVAIFFLSLVIWAGSLGRDYREHVAEATGLIPSALLLMLLIVYQPLSSGNKFAEGHSAGVPRDSRAPLYFGFSMLTAGALYFYLSFRTVSGTGEANPLANVLDRATGVGALLIGLPYLLWLYKTRQDRFHAPSNV